MGACCELFEKDEEDNESRLKSIEGKVVAKFHTLYDPEFTYYLNFFDQHAYL